LGSYIIVHGSGKQVTEEQLIRFAFLVRKIAWALLEKLDNFTDVNSKTAQRSELIQTIASRTGLNEGEILLMLMELRDAIIFYNAQGRGVRLEGLGTYLPSINYQREYKVAYRPDKGFKNALNDYDRFTGRLVNKVSIGKTAKQIFAQWNEEHPDDQVI
jgi:hypothetical protein